MTLGPVLVSRSSRWTRDLPPLGIVLAALALLAMILPNALRIPQQDPSPVLEYAPVPPTDESPPNPQGNMSSLALGSSSTVSKGAEEPPPPPPPPGTGDRPSSKRCVGNPPRQTEDLMSPPCVPFFDGDNFGETWQGVSEDEIRILAYFDSGSYNNESSPPGGSYIDLDAPPKPPCPKGVDTDPKQCDHQLVRQTRAMCRYFETRFQTYKRHAHCWAYFSNSTGSATGRKADAAANWETIKPFAVLDQATFNGNNQAYQDALAARGVLVFTSETALPNRFFRKYPTYAWGFWPDVEHWADMYVSYVCTKVAPYPVKRMGNPPGTNPKVGDERRFGLFYTTDKGDPGLHRFRDLVKGGLRRCGVRWVAEGNFPENRYVVDARDNGVSQAEAVARFIDAGVTTVLYLGGVEGQFSKVADARGYYPEIVLAGDLNADNNYSARHQSQTVWQNAWATHFQLRLGRPEETPGFAAYREAYPQAPVEEARYVNDLYRDHFMLFQAIQVAGPRLRPETVDKGFHAIPPRASKNPYVASCFFDPGDYSCVKDAAEIWWDPSASSPGDGQPGCWRMVRDGARALAGKWQGRDDVFRSRADPCTGYDASRRLRLG